jgi:predicted nucleotide-binding protein
MALPLRTTLDDIFALCTYFSAKPTGATIKDAKAVLGSSRLDPRKINALKFFGYLEEQDQRLRVTSEGRAIAKNIGAARAAVFVRTIRKVDPYRAIVERAAYQQELSLITTDVAAHWHDHFKDIAGGTDDTLNDQAVCFFHIVQGGELVTLVLGGGRKGPTRVDFDEGALASFISDEDRSITASEDIEEKPLKEEKPTSTKSISVDSSRQAAQEEEAPLELGQGIFIAHGKNKKPLDQLKRILDQFKIQYRVAVDEANLGRPISSKVREIMQSCNCAILIFTADEEFKDKDANTIWRPSENVVYELGAASYLYGNRVVIMKEDTVDFPSNFRDVGYISFANDQLEAKAMEILRELIGFGIVKVST